MKKYIIFILVFCHCCAMYLPKPPVLESRVSHVAIVDKKIMGDSTDTINTQRVLSAFANKHRINTGIIGPGKVLMLIIDYFDPKGNEYQMDYYYSACACKESFYSDDKYCYDKIITKDRYGRLFINRVDQYKIIGRGEYRSYRSDYYYYDSGIKIRCETDWSYGSDTIVIETDKSFKADYISLYLGYDDDYIFKYLIKLF